MADDFASAETSVENRLEESERERRDLARIVGELERKLEESERERRDLTRKVGELKRKLEESVYERRDLERALYVSRRELEESERERKDLEYKVAYLERNDSSREPAFEVAETYGPDRSTKGPSMKPCNCELIDVVYLPNESDAVQAARNYYLEKPKQNCCTILGCQVTKWSLPSPSSPRNMVKLKKAAAGTYFLCHIDLDVEW